MSFALVPPLIVAIVTIVAVAFARRLRTNKKGWTPLGWIVLLFGGSVAALLVRVAESLIVEVSAAGWVGGAQGLFRALVAFGIVGPLTVLTLTAIVWPALGAASGNRDDVDPPLAAAAAASGFIVGRLVTQIFLERTGLGSGVRLGVLALDEVTLAATWGYGLALSGFDGRLGGTPFGRYALGTIMVRGAVEMAMRSPGPLGIPFAISVGGLALMFSLLGIRRLARHTHMAPSSLAQLGSETIREIARSELRRGGVRPIWIAIGALGNVGGILVGFAVAVFIGHSAHIDFGEIDRSGPAAEYAAMLLALGVIMSFPVSAAVVGIASGGREHSENRAHVLEAGIAATVALGGLLFVLGVVAPVAVALGIACAPVAFVLAGLGAWIAAGRNV